MAFFLESRKLAQVSMNLLDSRRTPVRAVGRHLEAEARRRGLRVLAYELVGCAPADAFAGWPAEMAPVAGLKESQLLDSGLFLSTVG
jgi:glutamate formiminotransferase